MLSQQGVSRLAILNKVTPILLHHKSHSLADDKQANPLHAAGWRDALVIHQSQLLDDFHV